MNLKTGLILIVTFVLGIVFSTYLVGGVLLTQVTAPFSTIENGQDGNGDITIPKVVVTEGDVQFIHADIEQGWIPYIIKQVSILIGALSLIVFFYAGVNMIIKGDNEEEYSKSLKMIIFGIVGIALAAFSYSIIANVLVLF